MIDNYTELTRGLLADMADRTVTDSGALTFDLHPLYASILEDGAAIRRGDVLGLDGDLRRVLIAPFDGTMRLLTLGEGPDRRVKVFLTERVGGPRRAELSAAGSSHR